MHDAVQFEEAGIPANVIVTDVFTRLAEETARNLGITNYQPSIINHPLFTRDDDWLQAAANELSSTVIARLTTLE